MSSKDLSMADLSDTPADTLRIILSKKTKLSFCISVSKMDFANRGSVWHAIIKKKYIDHK
jgi:hypothetical protein